LFTQAVGLLLLRRPPCWNKHGLSHSSRSTRSSRLARHVERVESCRVKWNFCFISSCDLPTVILRNCKKFLREYFFRTGKSVLTLLHRSIDSYAKRQCYVYRQKYTIIIVKTRINNKHRTQQPNIKDREEYDQTACYNRLSLKLHDSLTMQNNYFRSYACHCIKLHILLRCHYTD